MRELEANWKITLKIWWAWTWRSLVVSLLFGVLFGFCITLIGRPLGIEQMTLTVISNITGFIIGLSFGVYYLKIILGKQFKDFRIAIIRTTEEI